MFATLLTLALVAAPALAAFNIETPQLTQCASAKLSWSGGNGPYNLVVVNSTAPCGDILADLGDHAGNSIHWTVDFPAGSTLMLSLEDKNEEEAWSGAIVVGKSSDVSCLKGAAAPSSSASKPASSAPAAPSIPSNPVQAAGAGVPGGAAASGDDDKNPGVAGALGATSGASVLRMNPVMALSAVFAAALML
ncbi:hypothetical protein MIND_00253900 [Mycena indigotica]|uniref:Uncharacterized protein n=1 Tax=Mycena indigotica TaxID=2126181 RepID=A0A8H6T7M5_9AGAR|nr:uncharacterized protein MIND_00253900 [Mycena indigotica]KAF7312405.1 hypothetical protein MIND_00253900 [Mycena indigotica]